MRSQPPARPAFASGAPLPHRRRPPPRRARRAPAAQLRVSRRALLTFPLALALPLPRAALADRTGKYSTKLTAKRRYVPRIARGAHALLSDEADVTLMDDMLTAMDLFGTTYFSEGNRISERERELKDCVHGGKSALKQLLDARRKADVDGEQVALQTIKRAAEQWLRIADFERIAGVALLSSS